MGQRSGNAGGIMRKMRYSRGDGNAGGIIRRTRRQRYSLGDGNAGRIMTKHRYTRGTWVLKKMEYSEIQS